ncbi:MAG: serine/threonine-protein kinase [Brevundimonas sp.]
MSQHPRETVPTSGPATPPARPRVLGDRYRLDGVVGRGGMAVVHRAHDLLLGRDVAIKLFPPVSDDADDLLRHSAEIRILATLSHPGLVTLYDAGAVHDGDGSQEVYLVMELVDGATLADRLRSGPMPVEESVRIGQQVATALALVHEEAIVHRDIKPGNILVAADAHGPVVKVADFGIARLSSDTRLTQTGVTVGTVRYLSPEQVMGSSLGPTSDVYSLGLVLIECLTGEAPFAGTLSESAAARLASSPPLPDGLPPDLARLLAAMTANDPDERPTAAEVADRLARLALGPDATQVTEVIAVPPTQVVPNAAAPSRARRRPLLWGAAAVVGALVVAGVVVAAQDDSGGAGSAPLPSYPAVPGELGDALTTLQESVTP